MSVLLKVDIINRAYSIMRISGITSIPVPEELELALDTLESLANELEERNVCTGYNLQDDPDPNEAVMISKGLSYSMASVLANRLLSDFGKDITPSLMKQEKAAWSLLYSSTVKYRQTQYPKRMPIGMANTLRYRNRWFRFYQPIAQAPLDCDTKKMVIGDTNDFAEHFDSYLRDTEDIASYTIDSDPGLQIDSHELSSSLADVDYTITAVSSSGTNYTNALQQVVIIATTTEGRVETRLINFRLAEVNIS
jgi:hypothetical protein